LLTAGLPPLTHKHICALIADDPRQLLARASGLEPLNPRLGEMRQAFFDYYDAHPVERTTLLEGSWLVLNALASDLPLALCTNKRRANALAVLEAMGLASLFKVVVAEGDLPESKPHPGPLMLVASRLELGADELVMVGDSACDVSCARAAGALSIGLREDIFGQAQALRAARPDVLCWLREVPEVVARLR
jgi:phosphoglycolate phosphatase